MRNNTPHIQKRDWRLSFGIAVMIIGLLMFFLLEKLNTLQHTLEKEKVNEQVQYFRLGLTENWLSQNITHKNSNINDFEITNPMLLIAELPKNYIGEFANVPIDQKAVWFYHTQLKQLIYILNNRQLMRYQLTKNNGQRANATLPNGGFDLIAIKD